MAIVMCASIFTSVTLVNSGVVACTPAPTGGYQQFVCDVYEATRLVSPYSQPRTQAPGVGVLIIYFPNLEDILIGFSTTVGGARTLLPGGIVSAGLGGIGASNIIKTGFILQQG